MVRPPTEEFVCQGPDFSETSVRHGSCRGTLREVRDVAPRSSIGPPKGRPIGQRTGFKVPDTQGATTAPSIDLRLAEMPRRNSLQVHWGCTCRPSQQGKKTWFSLKRLVCGNSKHQFLTLVQEGVPIVAMRENKLNRTRSAGETRREPTNTNPPCTPEGVVVRQLIKFRRTKRLFLLTRVSGAAGAARLFVRVKQASL